MSEPTPYSARWWNERMERALERVTPILEGWAETYLEDGYPMGYKPVDMQVLLDMPIDEAMQTVAKLIEHPLTSAQGVKLARQLMERAVRNESFAGTV